MNEQPQGPAEQTPPPGASNGAGGEPEPGFFESMSRGDPDPSPAREMSMHLLRMLETRMDAAGIAIQGETQLLLARVQLKLFAAAAIFFAVFSGIILLAIALPPGARVPVLSAVMVTFIILAVVAQMHSKRKASTHEVGSLFWFLENMRQDLEVLSRALARSQQSRTAASRSNHDVAA